MTNGIVPVRNEEFMRYWGSKDYTKRWKRKRLTSSKNKFRSQLEANVADQLDCELIDYTYEKETIAYQLLGQKKIYTPDFVVRGRPSAKVPKNQGIYIECKGWLRDQDVAKYEAVRLAHPELDLRFIFVKAKTPLVPNETGWLEVDHWWQQKGKPTYAEWAESIGCKWTQRECPAEWVEEMRGLSFG